MCREYVLVYSFFHPNSGKGNPKNNEPEFITRIRIFFQVIVGGALRYKIGKLSYASLSGSSGPLTKPTVIAIVVVIVVIFMIFLCFLIAYRRKSTESSRVLKNMQEQMDILELRVAAECKEGIHLKYFFKKIFLILVFKNL